MKKKKSLTAKWMKEASETHKIWHRFSGWIDRTYGKDLHGKWQSMKVKQADGKIKKLKLRSFDELELSRRLVGYEVQCRVERYIKRYCPEIKIIHCDDSIHASSILLLIPHPSMGITIIFIPQCTSIQNQFFLYSKHYAMLMKELKKMKPVYTEN